MASTRVIAVAAAALFALTACGPDAKPVKPAEGLVASPSPSESPSPSPSPSAVAVSAAAVPTAAVPTTRPKTTAPAAPRTTRPAPPKTTAPASVYYANCAAVKAAGKAPLYRGQPGYRAALDRDGDGVACET